ncbi:MAG: proteasome assembly chaperone family protein [Actinomycetota bacterium]
MSPFQVSDDAGDLERPVLLAAFDGWIDAAGASTAAVGQVASDATPLVEFDPDALYDFRSRRPVLDIVDGTLTDLSWPELTMRRTRHGDRDVVVFTGAEPDYRWQELGRDTVEIVRRLGVREWISLGSIPAAVPHTRPVPVLANASGAGLLRGGEEQGPQGLLRVPSAALSTVELAVSGAGIPCVGFYAQIPHYVGGPFPSASVALLEHVSRQIGVDIAPGELLEQAAVHRQRLDEAVASDDDSRSYVERLENMVDEERIPSGDELASEIERFLREDGRGGGESGTLGDA